MKKKYLIWVNCLLIIMIVGFCLYVNDSNSMNYVLKNETGKSLISSNALTMMYETGVDTGEYQVSGDSTWPQEGYTFNEELSKCENGSKLTWNEESKQVLLEANKTDKCYVYFDVYVEPTFADTCRETGSNTLACKVATSYTEDSENGLYYHDGSGTYGSQEAGDNSYRYAGANPNNYVCFGTDASTCPTDNLYRIIGVFDGQVKLIKHEYANSDLLGTNGAYTNSTYTNSSSDYYKGTKTTINRYHWNSSSSNTWSASNLNTVNLNTNYLNNIGSKWSNLIATHTWEVGGITTSERRNPPKAMYGYEVANNSTGTTYNAKIGLMYISDYGFAASPANWGTSLHDYDNDTNRNNNWMFMGLYEWTISRRSDVTASAFLVYNTGRVGDYLVYNLYGVRPSFYLESTVGFSSGSGTQTDPFRIKLPSSGGDTSDND